LPDLAFFLYQLDEPYIVSDDASDISRRKDYLMTFTTPSQFALLFVKLFTSGWPQQQLQASSRYANDWIRIHQHFRYLSIVSDKKLDEPFCSGIRCHRVRDTISSPNNYPKGQFTIQECRYSVALSARNGPVMPPFVVLTLFDG